MGVSSSPSYFLRFRLSPWVRARRNLLPLAPLLPLLLPTNHRLLPRGSQPPSQPDSMVQLIRAKLSDADIRKGANADELAALDGFYAARTQGPLWVTEMGFSTKAQAALFEIEKADDWGLDASVFELPAADALPKTSEERAVAEIKLDLAILKYARFARGGRVNPPTVSRLFDQAPPLRDPKTVLADIAEYRRAGSISSITPSQARAVHASA